MALTAYAYRYCDNDSYRKFSLAIVTNRPGSPNLGPFTLSGLIRSLKPGKMLRYDYVPEFRSALYAPQPLAAMLERR